MDQAVRGEVGVNNAMSSAVVMGQSGNVLATREQFFFFDSFLVPRRPHLAGECGDPDRVYVRARSLGARTVQLPGQPGCGAPGSRSGRRYLRSAPETPSLTLPARGRESPVGDPTDETIDVGRVP